MRIPTREELRAQVREMMKINPHYRQCINCLNYDSATSICLPKGVKVYPRVPGCNQHELAEERIITDATQTLYVSPANAEDIKIENMLSLGLTTVNAGTLFLEDAETRIRKIYKACKDKDERRGLRKDLDIFEQLNPAARKMAESIRAIEDAWDAHMEAFMQEAEDHLADVEVQYRQYFQGHLDKIFKKDGKYDGDKDALFMSSAGTFCLTILDKLKAVMAEENEEFPFNDNDLKRYKIKR
jgi:hypothetical protein